MRVDRGEVDDSGEPRKYFFVHHSLERTDSACRDVRHKHTNGVKARKSVAEGDVVAAPHSRLGRIGKAANNGKGGPS
jgi:hypothetical protein